MKSGSPANTNEDRSYNPDPSLHDNLVRSIVVSFKRNGSKKEFLDMMQAGRMGLILACQRYDRSRGVKVSTYAHSYIVMMIRREMMGPGFPISVPAYLVNRDRSLISERSAGRLDVLRSRKVVGTEKLRSISANCQESREDDIEQLDWALGKLGDVERRVIAIHYGLEDQTAISLRDTAREMGIGADLVFRIHRNAIRKLKSLLSEEDEDCGLDSRRVS